MWLVCLQFGESRWWLVELPTNWPLCGLCVCSSGRAGGGGLGSSGEEASSGQSGDGSGSGRHEAGDGEAVEERLVDIAQQCGAAGRAQLGRHETSGPDRLLGGVTSLIGQGGDGRAVGKRREIDRS